MKVSRIMSTQHPDNVHTPFFSDNSVIGGDEEIKEAFYVYSHLGIDEQLWDCEGKETDNYVVKKLLTRYPNYFKKIRLGKDKFLTLRAPNPDVEKAEGKVLLETLESIPRNYDVGKLFYEQDIAPIFEVVIPMCSSEKDIIRVHEYYKKFVIEKQNKPLVKGDISIAKWIGRFGPANIRVTPLFESKEAILNSDRYTKNYIKAEKIKELQRVWFARSDPALNYGSAAAVLLLKIGLQRLYKLQEETSVEILPIIGCGTAPFRGNFRPDNAKSMLRGYPSIQTFTVQSAFKYDFPVKSVINAVETVNETKRMAPVFVDEINCLRIIKKMEKEYTNSIKILAQKINQIAGYVPQRRKRKLHIGLFGYSRATSGIKLPRAIKFCASLYSLGLPPEIFGLGCLTEKELDEARQYYRTIDEDMAVALNYFNKDNLKYFPPYIRRIANNVCKSFSFKPDEEHKQVTSELVKDLKKQDHAAVAEKIVRAGRIRKFLG